MLAARVYGPEDLRLEEVDAPVVKDADDILLKVRAVGICGSDVHILRGENPFVTYPRVMGHEVVGELVDKGSGVTDLELGDHIVVEPILYGGRSYACRRGMPNVSEDLRVNGVHIDGGMQQMMLIKHSQAHKVSKSLPWTTAVLAEPYTIGANSCARANVLPADRVLVQGAGPIGITILRMAKVRGALVMSTDIVDDKLAFAKSCGADVTVNTREQDLGEAVAEWTDGEMANVIIDAVCLPQTFRAAFDLVSVAGTIVVLGMSDEPAPIPQKPFMQKQLTVVGTRLQAYQFDPVIRLLENGVLRDDGLVTQTFDFHDVNEAFRLIFEHPEQTKKVVLTFD